ncbi:hypothetical protein EDC04DRAFT_2716474 [Pisolithus marmoratus]|nr:hypothetical protein EDC04DRAFT_2716474 [Pisolithus marmoratus]
MKSCVPSRIILVPEGISAALVIFSFPLVGTQRFTVVWQEKPKAQGEDTTFAELPNSSSKSKNGSALHRWGIRSLQLVRFLCIALA